LDALSNKFTNTWPILSGSTQTKGNPGSTTVSIDWFFYRSDVIRVVEGLGLDWLMAARKSKRKRRQANQARRMGRPCFRYTMNPGKDNETCFHVFTVPAEKGGYHFFASSREARILGHWAGVYRLRRGIETGYRVKKGFTVRTAVRSLHVRLCFWSLCCFMMCGSWWGGWAVSRRVSSGTAWYASS